MRRFIGQSGSGKGDYSLNSVGIERSRDSVNTVPLEHRAPLRSRPLDFASGKQGIRMAMYFRLFSHHRDCGIAGKLVRAFIVRVAAMPLDPEPFDPVRCRCV